MNAELYRELDSIGSTNDEIKRLWLSGHGQDGLIIRANEQTAGRGRLDRGWHSPRGNFYASFSHSLDQALWAQRLANQPGVGAIGFVASLAMLEVLDKGMIDSSFPNERPLILQLKWPNDILLNGKKLAGILCETLTLPDQTLLVIVGMGVNILHHPALNYGQKLNYHATSLREEGYTNLPSLSALGQAWQQALLGWWAIWLEQGFEPIRQAWLKLGPKLGQVILYNDGSGHQMGTFINLTPDGSLELRNAQGNAIRLYYGDIISQ